MPNPSFNDLISTPNPGLVGMGVAPGDASALRERTTGHLQHISKQWLPTIGLWGGIYSRREIADIVGRDAAAVHSYATRRSLRLRTKDMSRTPAELAVAALVSMPKSAREAAPELGLLPVEVVLYRLAMTTMLELNGATLADVLVWSCDQLEATWAADNLRIRTDESSEYVDFSDPDAIAAIAAEAEAEFRDDPGERAMARAERESEARRRASDPPSL